MRKLLGFVLGFGGAFALAAFICNEAGVMIRGGGWLFAFISAGALGMKLAVGLKPEPGSMEASLARAKREDVYGALVAKYGARQRKDL